MKIVEFTNDKLIGEETEQEVYESLLASFTRKPLKPPKPPTAEQKAQAAWAQPLGIVVKANAQSDRKALERAEAELKEAERVRERERYRHLAQIVNEQAIERAYQQQQWEALAARRYDPMGLYGPPNYKTNPND
jgi:hypothetical protein